MRLIDADAIRYDQLLNTGNKEHPLEWAVSQSLINSMPTVSQHVQHVESVGEDGSALKHGHWIDRDDGIRTGTCSVCGWNACLCETDVSGMPYCPKCGAKMDEVKE